MSSSKNNVNPDHFKTAGRERPGQDVNQEINKQKYTEAQAEISQRQKNEFGSDFIPAANTVLADQSISKEDIGQVNEDDKSSGKT